MGNSRRLPSVSVAGTVAVLATAALVVTACGSSNDSGGGASAGGSSGDKVTVTFASNTNTKGAFDPAIKAFEAANPNITIKPTYYDINDYQNIIPTQFAGGKAPDIVWMPASAGAHSVNTLAKAGRLVDLSNRAWKDRIVPSALPNITVDNKIYAWPMGSTPYTFPYNVDEFAKLGLKVPTTYAELLNTCKQIKAAGKVPIAAGVGTPTDVTIVGQQVSATDVLASNPQWTADRAKGTVKFATTPGWTSTLNKMAELNKDCFEEGAAGTTREQAYQLFTSGKALITVAPSTSIGGLLQPAAPDMKIGVMPLPGNTPDQTRAVGIVANTIGVNAAAKNKDAAIKFVDFMATPDQAQKAATTLSQISPDDTKAGTLPEPFASTYADLYKNGKVVDAAHTSWSPEMFAAFNTQVQGIFTGQRSASQILQGLDQTWDASTK